MTTQEIYSLSNELTEKQIENVINGWKQRNENESLDLFETLIKLGDSKSLACATVIAEKFNKKDNTDFYISAYTN